MDALRIKLRQRMLRPVIRITPIMGGLFRSNPLLP